MIHELRGSSSELADAPLVFPVSSQGMLKILQHIVYKNNTTVSLLRRSQSTVNSGTKTLSVVVTSLRIDRILATGLAIGRRKIEYSLLSGLVKLNGETVSKKSIEVTEGDIIDKISLENSTETTFALGRVHLIEIGETTKKGDFKVILDRTKILQIPKEDYTVSWKSL